MLNAEKHSKAKKPVEKGKVARVPVVMQMEAMECGAASLCMILAYYGKWVPLEKMRSQCGVSRDGASAKNLLRAAEFNGLTAQGFKLEPTALRDEGLFPCIVHVGFSHFVVVDGIKGDTVHINDPARGRVKVSMQEFDNLFTGVTVFFEPNERFVADGKPASVIDFIRERLRGATSALVFAALTTIVTSVVAFVNPAFSRVFLDRILSGENPDWIIPLIGIMAALGVIQLAMAYLKAIQLLRVEGKMAVVGNSEFFWKVLNLPMDFFSQRMAGDIISRQETNASIAATVISVLSPLVLNSIMMFVYLFVLINYSPILTIIGVFSVLFNAISARYISQKRIDILRMQRRDAGRKGASVVSGVRMISTIKSSGAEQGYFEKWAGYQAAENNASMRAARLNTYMGGLPTLITQLTNIAVLGMGAYLTFSGNFTVGMLLAFQGFLAQFNAPVSSLISAGQTIQEMRVNMERIDDVMKYDAAAHGAIAPDELPDDVSGKLTGAFEMKNVTFGYSPLAKPIVRDLNIKLSPGKRVAIVGASGCGKSTVAKLLAGLYKPWSGEILFDGKPIGQIARPLFGASVAVVDQDVILFEDTIRNNIKMWDTSIEEFEMIMAARDASVHEDIMQRRGGYDAMLTEGGKDLSGGQRQRMEIARVLAQEPSLIILDEATSALDAKTEYEVIEAIRKREIACVVIAHRLSTIRDCDEIIYLDKGKIIERGTHNELYAKGGAYAQLVSND